MKAARKRIRLHAVGVALCGALLVAACETDNVTDLTDDRPVLKMTIAPGDAVFPSGSVALSKAVVSGFDFSVDGRVRPGDGSGRVLPPREQWTVHGPRRGHGPCRPQLLTGSPASRPQGEFSRARQSLRHV